MEWDYSTATSALNISMCIFTRNYDMFILLGINRQNVLLIL